jgi:hypothetical protein
VKWFKNLSEGTINILNQSYSIKHNNNKRELLYNENDMLISTKPYVLPLNKTNEYNNNNNAPANKS